MVGNTCSLVEDLIEERSDSSETLGDFVEATFVLLSDDFGVVPLMLSTKSDVVVTVESADFVFLGSSVEYSPGVLLLISSSVVYGVEGSLLVSGKGVAVETSLLGLDRSEFTEPVVTVGFPSFVVLSESLSLVLSSMTLLLVVLDSIEGVTSEVLSKSVPSSVGVTVDKRLVESDASVLSSEASSLFGVVGRMDFLEVVISSFNEDDVKSLVGITDGGVDEIGIEGLGSSLVPIDGPSELLDFVDSFSLDPSSVDVASPLPVDDSLVSSVELSVASSDLVVFEEDLVLNLKSAELVVCSLVLTTDCAVEEMESCFSEVEPIVGVTEGGSFVRSLLLNEPSKVDALAG